MQNSAYSRTMWCPLLVSRYGQAQHPWGQGSFGMNIFFQPGGVGGGLRRDGDLLSAGQEEPFLMPGKVLDSNPKIGTFRRTHSSMYPYDTNWSSLFYEYANTSLGLFVDGHTDRLTLPQGMALNGYISNASNLK